MTPRHLRHSLVVAAAASVFTIAAAAKDDPMSRTGTRDKADADMQSVLDALAAMHPKPIETLEPAQAREQPTPADAVMAVLKKKGKPTDPTELVPGVTSKDSTISCTPT